MSLRKAVRESGLSAPQQALPEHTGPCSPACVKLKTTQEFALAPSGNLTGCQSALLKLQQKPRGPPNHVSMGLTFCTHSHLEGRAVFSPSSPKGWLPGSCVPACVMGTNPFSSLFQSYKQPKLQNREQGNGFSQGETGEPSWGRLGQERRKEREGPRGASFKPVAWTPMGLGQGEWRQGQDSP